MTFANHAAEFAGLDADGTPGEVVLEQPDAVAAATPAEGFWCTALRVRYGDGWLPVVDEPPSWTALRTRPTFYGNPLLCPYPLSINGGVFVYRGHSYTVRSTREGRPIHGLARDNRWTLEAQWRDGEGMHVRASIATGIEGTDPDLLHYFPFPFRFRVTYSLLGTALTSAYEATNLGDGPMPFGLGIHPYFPVPIIPGGVAGDALVRSDAAQVLQGPWDARAPAWAEPTGDLDLRVGQRVDTLLRLAAVGERPSLLLVYRQRPDLDAPFSGGEGGLTWSLIAPAHGLDITVEASDAFRALVVYAPPTQHVISPVVSTCLSDAFNLRARGLPSGTIELEPGETWRGWTRIRVSTSGA